MITQPTADYPARAVDEFLRELGYQQVGLSPANGLFNIYENSNFEEAGLPEVVTLSYPSVAIGGDLYFKAAYVYDLLDRLSGVNIKSDAVLRAIKKLQSKH